jgi:two-component system LytT family response regulator
MRIHVSIVDEPETHEDAMSLVISVPAGDRASAFDAETLARLVAALAPPDRAGYRDRIAVKTGGRILLLRAHDVDWIEAEGNYVLLHAGKDAHILRETIGNLEAQLDPARFRRIHRSTIVNVDRIRELRPQAHGDARVVLDTGAQLPLSRGYRDELLRVLSAEA